ncbi:FHA domain-containing protein [Tolypothrix sp. VBCCA 56010]|uniref:FHA domain-containing protein n=1 Tax=Tolypothrix sp. VBCCA 56010 TaxID=3137731 RepID=UPI003D7EB9FA
MQIQLYWIDPNTGESRQPLLQTPVAIGREFSQMPQQSNAERVSRVVIQDDLIADYHALIDWQNQELIIIDQNTSSGIKINGVQLTNGSLRNGDRLQIGSSEIVVNFTNTTWECDRMVGFLFKRRCGRTDKTGCPHCNESYEEDYAYYGEYGNYRSGNWGHNYYEDRDRYSYNPETGNVDFTEADSVSLDQERDVDFERNMGAS